VRPNRHSTRAGIGARSSYDGDKAKAPAIKRMRRIDDFNVRRHGYVSVSRGGIL
jgi:hypothetical protein